MFFEILLIILGIFLLTKGADWLVDGSSDLASFFRIAPIYVGLTVVAFGTSLPELIVSLYASISGKAGISIGNIIGSNIANVGLIIGLTAFITPILVKKKTVKIEFPIMIGISLLFVLLLQRFHFSIYALIIVSCLCTLVISTKRYVVKDDKL